MTKIFSNLEIYGTGTTSSGTALEVKNSGATSLFRVRNDGLSSLGAAGTIDTYFWTTNSASQQLGFTNENGLSGIFSNVPNVYFMNGGSGGNTFTKITTANGNWMFGSPSSNVYSMNISDSKMTIQGSGASSVGNVLKVINSADTSLMLVRNDGTVMVNATAVPTNVKLYTKVDINSDYAFIAANSGNSLTFAVRGDNRIGINGSATSDIVLDIKNPFSDLLPLRVLKDDGTALFAIFNAGYTNIKDRLFVGDYFVNPTATIHARGVDASASNFTLKLVDSGDTIMLAVRNDGKVGIGTITPTDKLSIYTAKTATSTATPDSINLGGTFSNAAGTNLKFKIYDDGGSIGGFGISSGQLDYKTWSTGADHVFYADTDRLVTIKGTGAVGIGVNAPGARLDISGGTSNPFLAQSTINGSGVMGIFRNNDGGFDVGQEIQLDFQQQTSTLGRISSTYFGGSDYGFNFYGNNGFVNTTPIITFRGNGYVGIGTTGTTAKLQIKGETANSSNFGLKIVDSGDTLLSYVRNDGYAAFDRYLRVGLRGDYGQLDVYGYTDPSSVILDLKNKNEQTIFNFRQETYNPYFRMYSNGNSTSTIGIDGAPNGKSYLNDYLGIGFDANTLTGITAKLHIKGVDTGTTNYTLKLVNSADTALFMVRNDGIIEAGQNSVGNSSLKIGRDIGTFGTGIGNVGIGYASLSNLIGGNANIAMGGSALAAITNGSQNSGFGEGVLHSNQIGNYNVALGYNALGNALGSSNVAVGHRAMLNTTGGENNVVVGNTAFFNNINGSSNTIIGENGGFSNSGSRNIFAGYSAGYNQTGSSDTLIIDNRIRANIEEEVGRAIIYGVLSTLPENQTLRFNANVGIGISGGTERLEISGNTKLSSLSNQFLIGTYTALKMSQGSGAPNISLGHNNTLIDADNGGGIVIGSSSLAASDGIAIGLNTSAYTNTSDAIAIGREATISNASIRGIAIGRQATVTASNAIAFGNYITAAQDDTVIIGNNSLGNKAKVGIWTSTPTASLDVSGTTGYNQLRVRTTYTPTGTADANGNTGDLVWDDSFFYVKTAAGWKRTALATF